MTSAEDTFLKRTRLVMQFFSVWVKSDTEKWHQKLRGYLSLTIQYSFLLFQILYMFRVISDLEALSQASYVLFTQACLCFKITVFLGNRKLVVELLRRMNSHVILGQTKQQRLILKSQAARIKKQMLIFIVSAEVTCLLWSLKPFLDDAGTRSFPFSIWSPMNTDKSPQYEIWYIYQVIALCTSALIYFGVDSVTLSMIIFGKAQIEIIQDKMIRLQPLPKEGSHNMGLKDNRETWSHNNKILEECVKRHQAIVEFEELVENAFHTYLFFQLSGSVGLICMSALRILVIEKGSMQFMSILLYVSVMIYQLFLCCWCGHELTDASSELPTILYNCLWYEQDMKFRKGLLIFMIRSGRPILFRAGHYIPLLRQTFVSILRMSYSYIAVLNQTV